MRAWFLLLLLGGCTFFIKGKDAPPSAKGEQYKISFDKVDWVLKKDDRSDYVFENKNDGRILLSNSFCGEFQEQPLDELAKKTFKTVDNFKSTKSQFTTFNDREAYRMEGKGSVDGVKVILKILNTRRNNCYFDFFSINSEKINSSDNSFEDFLKSVEFK